MEADDAQSTGMCLRVTQLFLPASIHFLGALAPDEVDLHLGQMFASMRSVLVRARDVSAMALEPWLVWLNALLHTTHSVQVRAILLAIAIKSEHVPTLVAVTRTLLRYDQDFASPPWLTQLSARDEEAEEDATLTQAVPAAWAYHVVTKESSHARPLPSRSARCGSVLVRAVNGTVIVQAEHACYTCPPLEGPTMALRMVEADCGRLLVLTYDTAHACALLLLSC